MHLRPTIGSLCLTLALVLTPLHAQTDHPASTTPVTRAVAVYEWTGPLDHPTAARLIPVSLFIHGHLEDAGVYLAQPIPFALQPGNVYLIQRSGQTEVQDGRSLPAGAETIGAFALQSAHSTPNNPLPAWFGYGHFLTPAETIAATTPPPPVPTLPPPSVAATPKQEKHKHHHNQPPPPKPTATTPAPQPAAPAPASIPELTTALPLDLHQAAAVSDAASRPAQSFAYTFPTPTSRDETLHTVETLALPSLTHYIAFNNLTPAPSTPTKGPTFANASTPVLTHQQLLAYTLSPSTPPTYILTAESPLTTAGPIYITLIAQPDSSATLHLTLLNITDATHLDRTPRLRLIDAVDPEATGRAALLFELRSQTTRQFALYTLTGGQPHQTLLTTPIE